MNNPTIIILDRTYPVTKALQGQPLINGLTPQEFIGEFPADILEAKSNRGILFILENLEYYIDLMSKHDREPREFDTDGYGEQ